MPRKNTKEVTERPPYINADGTLNISKIFTFQPKQTELLRLVQRNGKVYLQALAHQCLSVGGIRGGKTLGVLMYLVMHYCLAFKGCNVLVLRRTFKELESGAISDFKTFVPPELYTYNPTTHIAEFMNGSKVVFGHCVNNKERDLDQYLGQAYTAILIDECGQFSPDAWMRLYSRNLVNPACEPDEAGNLPIPVIWGCTNPLGPFYEFYRTVFVQKEPWEKPEDARKDETNGTWWVPEAGEWRLIYDPRDYCYQRTTVLDNPKMLERDPGIIARLNSMPKAKRDKMLLGLDGHFDGQYFDVWSEDYHVINLREDPDAIIWQPYQSVWVGQDWGVGHANAVYFFTRALVKTLTGDYKMKVVCFREIVVTGGKTHIELASLLANACRLPDGGGEDKRGTPIKPQSIFFSHEKFSRQVTGRSPADEYSRVLRDKGLPPVTRATTDRIGRASLMYNMLKNGDLVVLDYCKEIILAIPTLMRDPDELDDVLKTEAKGDDCYDAFAYGLFGQLASKKKPERIAQEEYLKELYKKDPTAAFFYNLKLQNAQLNENAPFRQKEIPAWMAKLLNDSQVIGK